MARPLIKMPLSYKQNAQYFLNVYKENPLQNEFRLKEKLFSPNFLLQLHFTFLEWMPTPSFSTSFPQNLHKHKCTCFNKLFGSYYF